MCKRLVLANDFVGNRFIINIFIISQFFTNHLTAILFGIRHRKIGIRHRGISTQHREQIRKSPDKTKRNYIILAGGMVLILLNLPQVQAGEDLTKAGDYLSVGIPVTAGVISIYKGDAQGLAQLVEGAIWTAVATKVLKETVKEERPNGEDDLSFPSSHVSAAMQGSVYLHLRYGLDYAAPAYAATAVVAYSRVDGEYHYWHDVVASMLLAGGIQYSITGMGYGISNLSLLPVIREDYYGFNLSFDF
jgi:hypothetical protein